MTIATHPAYLADTEANLTAEGPDSQDGVTCYVVATTSSWQLAKTSVLALGPDVLATMSGVGRWLKLQSSSSSVATRVDFFDDFTAGTAPSVFSWISNTAGAGSNATVGNNNLDGSHQGLIAYQTGSTATGRAGLRLAPTLSNVSASGGSAYCESLLQIENLSTALQEFTLLSGYNDTTGAGLFTTNAIQFVYNRAVDGVNWRLYARGGAAPQNLDSGVAVVSGAWVKLRIELTSTGAEFFIDGVSVGSIAQVNLPGALAAGAFGIQTKIEKTVGTTQRRVHHDYAAFGFILGTAR